MTKKNETMNENDLEKWVEIIKKHYAIMSGFHPETYKITLGDIEATARFFYDLGLKKAMEEKPTVYEIEDGKKLRSNE